MGIKGLIPLLKPIQKEVKISEYAGQRVAVDGHCWLHRGAFGCASELARGVQTDTYVSYFMNLVRMLLFYKVIPIIVFDGQRLPIKNVTNEARSKLRKEKLSQGQALYKQGNLSEADKCFQQAINITPAMIANVIKELDKIDIQHIVSPYEADPQLAYLVNSGQAQAVITEDSDLLAFGSSRVILKMDRFGEGQQVIHKNMFEGMTLGMRSFDLETFRYACILSGCDYLPSLPGIGLKKAQDLVRRRRTINGVMNTLQCTYSKKTVDEYKENFLKADAAFLYQFVFDSNSRTYIRLNPLPNDIKVDHLVGLGESPQNRDIPLLKSNKAIHINQATIAKEANKENLDPFVELEETEFSELEFDESVLRDVEFLLEKVDPVSKTESVRASSSVEALMTKVLSEALAGVVERPTATKKAFTVWRQESSPPSLSSLPPSLPTPTISSPPPSPPSSLEPVIPSEKAQLLRSDTPGCSLPSLPLQAAPSPQFVPLKKKMPSPFDRLKRSFPSPSPPPILRNPFDKVKTPFLLRPTQPARPQQFKDPFEGIKPFELVRRAPVVDISKFPDPFAKVKVPFTLGPKPKRKNPFENGESNKVRRL